MIFYRRYEVRKEMKTISEYKWLGHDIRIQAIATPRFLWLDCTFEVFIDDKRVKHLDTRSLTRNLTSFQLNHEGQKLKGQVVSSGLPLVPVVSQSTIVDDTILGHSQLIVSRRGFTYTFLLLLVLSLQFF